MRRPPTKMSTPPKLRTLENSPTVSLSLVPKSETPDRPELHAHLSGHQGRLAGSFFTAILSTCALGVSLTFIITHHEIFTTEDTTIPMEVTTVIDDTPPPEKKVKPHIRHSLISVNDRKAPVVPIYEKPVKPELADITPPASKLDPTMDLIALEETFESAWEEPKKPTPVVKPQPIKKPQPIAKVQKKGPDPREIEARNKRRAQERAAMLAKKISKQAQVVSRSTPTYPRTARRKGIEGRVIVAVTVSTSGKISSSSVSQSSSNSSLDAAALKAARKFRFSPAKNGLGQAVAVRKSIPFTFKLQG